MNSETMLDIRSVAERYGVSEQTVGRWVKRKKFPRPICPSPQIKRWPLAVIEAYELSFNAESSNLVAALRAAAALSGLQASGVGLQEILGGKQPERCACCGDLLYAPCGCAGHCPDCRRCALHCKCSPGEAGHHKCNRAEGFA